MISYQYQILYYIPDPLTSEHVNLGIVIFDTKTKDLKFNFISKYSRITNFFGSHVPGQHIINSIKNISRNLKLIQQKDSTLFGNSEIDDISQITTEVLQIDSSSIRFSNIKYGVDINFQSAFDDLYNRIILKYNDEEHDESKSDAFVWKSYYKSYFEKYDINKELTSHKVELFQDEIQFEKSWKNGSWNCFQPLSLEQSKSDYIKNKVYKWSGIINAMSKSDENIHLYFLTSINTNAAKGLSNFINSTLEVKTDRLEVTIIEKDQAETFAKDLKEKIEKHSLNTPPF